MLSSSHALRPSVSRPPNLDNDLAPPLPPFHGLTFDAETKGGDGDAGEGEIAGGDDAANIAPSVPGAF